MILRVHRDFLETVLLSIFPSWLNFIERGEQYYPARKVNKTEVD